MDYTACGEVLQGRESSVKSAGPLAQMLGKVTEEILKKRKVVAEL